MNELTPTDLLQIFPYLMYMWSTLVLGWGVIAGVLFYRMCKLSSKRSNQQSVRRDDRYALWLIASVNTFLLSFLLSYDPAVCTSWIAVVNVFYSLHLLYVSVDVVRWWSAIKRQYISSTPSHQ